MQSSHEIIIYYKYTPIPNPEAVALWMRSLCEELGIKGRILVAHEGINGTAEGTPAAIKEYEIRMHEQGPWDLNSPQGNREQGPVADFSDIWFKHSPGTGVAFKSLKIKVRPEIVTLGLGEKDVDPTQATGTHIEPHTLKSWILSGEEFEIVDMRNDYEFKVGHFKNSINPNLENFRDLPQAIPRLEPLKKKKVLAVCTYGVRCEKASAYLKQQGFEDVYQLNGGIGSYMKAYPGEDFQGSLYVFDERELEQQASVYEIVGVCEACGEKNENFSNCRFESCHKKMIVCQPCLQNSQGISCSEECDFRFLHEIHTSAQS